MLLVRQGSRLLAIYHFKICKLNHTSIIWLTPELPWWALAAAWKASNVFPVEGALIDPTIPTSQCGWGASCLQKNQMGAEVFVIVKFHVGNPPVVSGMKMLPESNPFPRGSHGLSNEDCVMEWFPGLGWISTSNCFSTWDKDAHTPEKVNITTSPSLAVTFAGEKKKGLDGGSPTVIYVFVNCKIFILLLQIQRTCMVLFWATTWLRSANTDNNERRHMLKGSCKS